MLKFLRAPLAVEKIGARRNIENNLYCVTKTYSNCGQEDRRLITFPAATQGGGCAIVICVSPSLASRMSPDMATTDKTLEMISCANADHAGCTAPATKKCSRCEDAVYCSVNCQKQHWEHHKAFCQEKLPEQPTELLPYTLVYYVAEQLQHVRTKDATRTAEISHWVIEFLETQFGEPIPGQWKRNRRERMLHELPAKATWPAELADTLLAEAKERIKDGLLRKDVKSTIESGKNLSKRSPIAELATMMQVESDCSVSERQSQSA